MVALEVSLIMIVGFGGALSACVTLGSSLIETVGFTGPLAGRMMSSRSTGGSVRLV